MNLFRGYDRQTVAASDASQAAYATPAQSAQAAVGTTMMAGGVWLVRTARMDPEPTTRSAIFAVGGVLLMIGGALSLLRAFGQPWRVRVTTRKVSAVMEPLEPGACATS
jgi:hypothetical protein